MLFSLIFGLNKPKGFRLSPDEFKAPPFVFFTKHGKFLTGKTLGQYKLGFDNTLQSEE